jgi:hypothetical protein
MSRAAQDRFAAARRGLGWLIEAGGLAILATRLLHVA